MYAWDRALHAGKLFSPALVGRMFTPNPQGYGLGWEVDERFGRKVYAHNGDINGFGAYVTHYPRDQVYVIVRSNIERTDVRRINDGLAEIALAA